MSVYVVAQLRFTNAELYRRYQKQFFPVFRNSGGKLLAADEAPAVLEGEWALNKIVIMEFNEADAARQFLDSPEYQLISQDRIAGAEATTLLVQGL